MLPALLDGGYAGLERFVFLLGGSDGEPSSAHDQELPASPARNRPPASDD
jgi:hypothetical protein